MHIIQLLWFIITTSHPGLIQWPVTSGSSVRHQPGSTEASPSTPEAQLPLPLNLSDTYRSQGDIRNWQDRHGLWSQDLISIGLNILFSKMG